MALYNNLITPYGVNIRTDYSATYNYAIPLMQTDCWPMQLQMPNLLPWQQVVIISQQNSFWSQQQGTMRAWLSINPNGINVIPSVIRNRTVNLQGIGTSWCFYDVNLPQDQIKPAQLQFGIDLNVQGDGGNQGYFFNIQNLSGQENAYYLRFEYSGHGGTYII